jgi:hypothetical protein
VYWILFRKKKIADNSTLAIAGRKYFIELLPFFVIYSVHKALVLLSPAIANAQTVSDITHSHPFPINS